MISTLLGRPLCDRCTRPPAGCFCSATSVLPTRTRVLMLQHPRERRMGVGTARLAHLALPNSSLRVGLDFAADRVVQEALARGESYVLFPRPGAIPITLLPRDRPITLLLVDGTWWQARKLLKLNPALAALPAVAFTPSRPSGYLIRKQPADFCVSTVEALAEVLQVLEPEGGPFERLLDPFRAMVERQRWFATEVRERRHYLAARNRRESRRPTLRARLAADFARIVCVQGEANAWSRRDPARQDPETVHWVACRPATGERYEAVIAPRRPLAPGTSAHVGLAAERLAAGTSAEAWRESWGRFSRADDLVVSWGLFYVGLAAREGLALAGGLDLRAEASRFLRRRCKSVEDCAAALGVPVPAGADRGGRRLATLAAIVGALSAEEAEDHNMQGHEGAGHTISS